MKRQKEDANLRLQFKKYEQLLDKELLLEKTMYKIQEEQILTNYLIHDLATPLSSAQAAFMLLESTPNAYGSKEVLESGRTSIESAVQLLESIRDLKKQKDRKKIYKLQDITKEVIKILNSKATKSNIQVLFDCKQEVYVNTYKKIYQRVLLNILNNSIEELADTSKTKKVITIKIEYSNGKAIISIKDTGRGIPPTLLKKVSKTYFSTKQKHLGLGLSFSKEFTRKHLNGILYVKSYPLEGTEIFLELQGFCKVYGS